MAMIAIAGAYIAFVTFALYLGLCAAFGRHSRRTVLANRPRGTRWETAFRSMAGLFVHRPTR
ncbi:hypothetical protein [Spirillospora sp. NPDC029432]|uniref:hypothetical protein n=1 Tax=Spirillospora sp. NPDC029432 TaxID=3154599 RepID=UPI0034544A91